MAFLKVVKGSCPGQILQLDGGRMVLGRHPNCEIVLDNVAVSRQHAQILQSHGTYYLEDLRSRNGTCLNGVSVEGRTELHEGDSMKVCDVVFSFHLRMPPLETPSAADSPLAGEGQTNIGGSAVAPTLAGSHIGIMVGDEPSHEISDNSSIITTLDALSSSRLRLAVKPEAKLRAMLEISKTLGQALKLDEVLCRILDGLFTIFPQVDAGFVLLTDPESKKLTIKATKSRSGDRLESLPHDVATVRISMTIVRHAMKSGEAILSADAISDKRFQMSESLTDLQIRSMMCAPLVGKSGDSLGVVQIDTKNVEQKFSETDLDLLLSVTSQASLAVENASLHEALLKQRDIERELDFATQVQLGFLPAQRPKLAGYEFSDFYEAALRVGGDFFDYVPLSDNRVAVALGDVAGKGVPAALLCARLFSAFRYHLLTKSSAAEALRGLNAELASSGLGHRFITCVLAIVDAERHDITIANAGHLPPIFRCLGGQLKSIDLKESGLPLGIAPDEDFHEVKIQFQPGDTCLLYTDGVTEAMNAKREIYGRQRLCDYILGGPAHVDALVKGIVADVEQFCEGHSQRDDMCLVGIRRYE